ncbi:hypothetical protein N0V85_002905 [Neurospora sp. IMI 360204]|nr:hypothetical protein N0V85_002905 [Neurospora sp. IMI 360204]
MSIPAKRKAASPAPETPAPAVPKTKTPTPDPVSPPPVSPAAAGEASEPAENFTGAYWLQQGLPEPDETDSTLGSDIESSTASISSSILNYRTINGRTYHSDAVTNGEYWGPNDPKHLDALEIFAHATDLMIGGKLHFAPITKTSNIRSTLVQEWTFKPDHFDYVHIRFLNGAIPDWAELYKQAYRVCKPGGWIEHLDASAVPVSNDDSIAKGSALEQYGILFKEAGKRLGLTQTTAEDNLQENGLKAAGFVNLTVKEFKMPTSPWPQDQNLKDVGLFASTAVSGDIEGIVQYVCGNVMGWSQEEMAICTAHLRKELKDKSIHGYWRCKLVYAQKPLE